MDKDTIDITQPDAMDKIIDRIEQAPNIQHNATCVLCGGTHNARHPHPTTPHPYKT